MKLTHTALVRAPRAKVWKLVTDVPAAVENGYVVGLHTSLSRLAPCLAGDPVPWDWDEFAEAQSRYAELGLARSAS